jgi:hypothetical protein
MSGIHQVLRGELSGLRQLRCALAVLPAAVVLGCRTTASAHYAGDESFCPCAEKLSRRVD